MIEESSNSSPERQTKRIHVAFPIRVTYWDSENKPGLEMACTYDISEHGARVTGLRCVKGVGEIVAVERGRNKAFCRVVWVGEPNSELQGQVGIQSVESDRTMWEAELRDMEEAYDPILMDGTKASRHLRVPRAPPAPRTLYAGGIGGTDRSKARATPGQSGFEEYVRDRLPGFDQAGSASRNGIESCR